MKVCNKCGNPLVPPSENHCEGCWFGEYTHFRDGEPKHFHQVIEKFVPEPAKENYPHEQQK